ncbi:stalk domain-containing protein [Paenibacillus thermoaerophilus]|uniref:Stalk domain-containing protein n=1 Tax=Paenibacillus thermoaerophilus TaxID=1215385 RepID=A0ABW2V1D1_9BACL|nr:stalk domain-containing protein [Paenibacillus thermoaerophilus]TMV18999.1 hypothetical protein FE781_00325 [Paenibacillus thermoaerophilus]
MRKQRKAFTCGLTVAAAALVLPVAAGAQAAEPSSPPVVSVRVEGGTGASLSSPARLSDSTAMVPLRELMESLGYSVGWDDEAGKALVYRPGTGIRAEVHPNGEYAVTNDGLLRLTVAAYIGEDGRMWAPLRPFAEWAGAEVKWDADRWAVTVVPGVKTIPIRLFANSGEGGPPSPEKLSAYAKETWKADFQFTFVPAEHYTAKAMVMIAAGVPDDLMMIDQTVNFNDELYQSVFHNLTPLLNDTPELMKRVERAKNRLRVIDGNVYSLPAANHPNNALFPAVRQDWLDRLGLETPETMDELYETLVKFRDRDADGNGKHDTLPIAAYLGPNDLGSLKWVEQVFTGAPDRFSLKDGVVVDHLVGSGQREALKWLAKAYAAGLIHSEFAVQTKSQALNEAKENRSGLTAMTIEEAAAWTAETLRASPDSRNSQQWWVPLPGLAPAEGGKRAVPWRSASPAPGYSISRFATTAEAKAFLAVYEQALLQAERGWDEAGFEPEEAEAAKLVFGDASLTDGSVAALPPALAEAYAQSAEAWERQSYADIELPLAAWIAANRPEYAETNQKLLQTKIKVILGAASLEDWDEAVAQLTASEEYKTMIAEMNAALK